VQAEDDIYDILSSTYNNENVSHDFAPVHGPESIRHTPCAVVALFARIGRSHGRHTACAEYSLVRQLYCHTQGGSATATPNIHGIRVGRLLPKNCPYHFAANSDAPRSILRQFERD
jgi:hypothetical protein